MRSTPLLFSYTVGERRATILEPMTGFGGDYGTGRPKSSLTERIIGVVTFKAPIYREIADDTEATATAAIIVILVAVITGLISGLFIPAQIQAQLQQNPEGQQAFAELGIDPGAWNPALTAIAIGIVQPITALISWAITSWLNALIATRFFQGRTDTSEMMRIFGFTSIFNIIGLIPFLGLIGWCLSVIGNVIGIREAAEFDLGKAMLTMVVSLIITLLIAFGIACCIVAVMFSVVAGTVPR